MHRRVPQPHANRTDLQAREHTPARAPRFRGSGAPAASSAVLDKVAASTAEPAVLRSRRAPASPCWVWIGALQRLRARRGKPAAGAAQDHRKHVKRETRWPLQSRQPPRHRNASKCAIGSASTCCCPLNAIAGWQESRGSQERAAAGRAAAGREPERERACRSLQEPAAEAVSKRGVRGIKFTCSPFEQS